MDFVVKILDHRGSERFFPNFLNTAALECKLNFRANVLAQECFKKKLEIYQSLTMLSTK
jgi:hypothetical protein